MEQTSSRHSDADCDGQEHQEILHWSSGHAGIHCDIVLCFGCNEVELRGKLPNAWFPSLRKDSASHRNFTGTSGLSEKHNTVITVCRTLAALPAFFCRTENACDVVHCVIPT